MTPPGVVAQPTHGRASSAPTHGEAAPARPEPDHGSPMHRLLRLAPTTLLFVSACSISSDHEGFSIEIGTGVLGQRHHATETRRLELDLAAGDLLRIEGLQGDVSVRTSSEGPQELVCVLGADGRSQEEAVEALRDVVVKTRRDGRELAFVVETPARELRDGGRFLAEPRSDLTLTVPPGIEVRIESSSGDIEVAGPLGPVHAETRFGGVTLSRIEGDASAQTDSGSIEIRVAEGGVVAAETSFGDVTLESIRAADVRAESSSGDLALRDVRAQSIEAHSSFGGIRLEAVEGDVTAKTDSGDVELEGALRGTHQLHSGFGEVDVVRAQGAIDASSNSGDVTVRDSAGSVRASSGFGSVSVEGVLSALSAESSSGDVDVEARHGSAAESDWRIVSRFGSVSLRVSDAFACDVDASTDFGDVEADFALTRAGRAGGSAAAGQLGTGGRRVELHTSSGDVALRRAAD
jgi:DUF4097 and DUF4098 domain-containing protein YvlB